MYTYVKEGDNEEREDGVIKYCTKNKGRGIWKGIPPSRFYSACASPVVAMEFVTMLYRVLK